jgi:hypothetical protein
MRIGRLGSGSTVRVASLDLRLGLGLGIDDGRTRRAGGPGNFGGCLVWGQMKRWTSLGGIFPHHLWDVTTRIEPIEDGTGGWILGTAAAASGMGRSRGSAEAGLIGGETAAWLWLAGLGRRFSRADGTIRTTVRAIALGGGGLILLQEESSICRFEGLIDGARRVWQR